MEGGLEIGAAGQKVIVIGQDTPCHGWFRERREEIPAERGHSVGAVADVGLVVETSGGEVVVEAAFLLQMRRAVPRAIEVPAIDQELPTLCWSEIPPEVGHGELG